MTLKISAALIAAGATSLALAPGAAAQRAMTVDDLFQLKTVREAAISPDGDHVAYAVSHPRDIVGGDEDGSADRHLWLGERGGEARVYVKGDITVSDVAWRPGAGTVTFTATREGDDHRALYEIDPSGGEAQRLFAHENSISEYVWGPEGETLYFVAESADPDEDYEDRGFNAEVYEENLAYADVWRVSFEDGAPGEADAFGLDGHASAVVMSNGGDSLAVALAPTPLIDDHYMKRRWHVVDADDGDVTAVIETPGKTGPVAFSPNDRRLAMIVGADINDTTAGTLAVANARNGDYDLIAREAEQHVMDMAWLDDDTILALAHVSTDSALVTYTRQGEETARVAQDELVIEAMDLHRESGVFAAIADAPTHPNEVFFGTAGGELQRLFDHNPQLGEIAFGEQRTYSYEARDGLRIDGVLMTPAGDTPEGGWPLILAVHGGPEAHDSDGWLTSYSDPGWIGTGKGYAVFYPNYRGSTGRGEDFTKLHQNDYAGGEFNDLADAVGALAEDGIADADRAGITGGSYGGYAAMWGATALSETFAASVAFVGVSNQISKFGTTDIPNEMYLVHSLKWPWEDWMDLLQRSPVFHAGNSQTPTLILHGERDTRVHPSQSMEMYRNLKLRSQAPVRLVFYPDEGHGNRNAAAQFDYAHRMLRWFEHYLQGEGGEPPDSELDFADLLGERET